MAKGVFGEGRQTKAGNGNGAIKRLQRRRSRPSPNSTHRPSPATCSVRRMRAPRPSPATRISRHHARCTSRRPMRCMRLVGSATKCTSSCCKNKNCPAYSMRGSFLRCAGEECRSHTCPCGELLDALNQLLPGMHIGFLINSVHMGFHSMVGHHKRFFNLRG